jgi:hypothetical protein
VARLPAVNRPDTRVVADIARAALAAALLVAVVAWRDTDTALRWLMPAIGFAGLGLVALTRKRPVGRWLAIVVGIWFVLFGVMLSLSVTAEQASVSGQYDPGPDVIAQLNRFQSWLDPMVHRPVAAVFVIGGTIGAVAAARMRPARH